MTLATATEVVDQILDSITQSLANGHRVSLPGFGTFSVSHRAARDGRNPATGESMHIPAKKVAKFKPGKGLADAVNG
jgi:DNA-binding protein HU-beta